MDTTSTLNEHITDHVGIDITYAAYQEHVKSNGPDPMLPGLDYTPNQLFWISAARPMCLVSQHEYYYHIDYEFQPPYEYSPNGALRNSKSFSDDFSCKVGSAMNPTNKCEMW